MLCMLTVRRLKPGKDEAFREAWAPHRWHDRMVRAYHLRSEDDPTQVITLGFFEGTEEEIDAMHDQPEWMAGEERRLQRIAPLEESVLLSGVWDVVEEIKPKVSSVSAGMPIRSSTRRAPPSRILERRAQQVVDPERPVAARERRVQRRPQAGRRGGVDRRRAEAAPGRVDVEPQGARLGTMRAIASSRCSLSMLPDPCRDASSRARMSAARASGESPGPRGGGVGRGGQVAVAPVRRLARDAQRPRDRGERLARLQGAGDVDALERVEALRRAARPARSESVGSGAVSARSSSDAHPPLLRFTMASGWQHLSPGTGDRVGAEQSSGRVDEVPRTA